MSVYGIKDNKCLEEVYSKEDIDSKLLIHSQTSVFEYGVDYSLNAKTLELFFNSKIIGLGVMDPSSYDTDIILTKVTVSDVAVEFYASYFIISDVGIGCDVYSLMARKDRNNMVLTWRKFEQSPLSQPGHINLYTGDSSFNSIYRVSL